METKRLLNVIMALVLTVFMAGSTFVVFGTDNISNESGDSNLDVFEKIAQIPDDAKYKEGQVLVVFDDTVSDLKAEKVADAVDGDLVGTTDVGVQVKEATVAVIETNANKDIEKTMTECAQDSSVAYVQPNYAYTYKEIATTKTTNDTDYSNLWHLNKINVEEAWKAVESISHSKVRVAVLDTGCNVNHEDLQISLNKDLCVDAADLDLNKSYANLSKITDDPDGHGTQVLGVIGATANNSKGVAGVAAGSSNTTSIVETMAVDVYEGSGEYAYTSDIIRGIKYAMYKDAKVINMSLGYKAEETKDEEDIALESAIDEATNNGITVVCAAGNEENDLEEYPAAFDSCISVISTDNYTKTSDKCKSDFSTYGDTCDISAPGSGIWSTTRNGEYGVASGTSFASPIVAGVAAMLYSIEPAISVGEVKNELYTTATDLYTDGNDVYTANGNVNAEAAVNSVITKNRGNDSSTITTLESPTLKIYRVSYKTLKIK